MNWKLFYELTEIYTSPLDLLWFIFAVSYSYYRFGSFNFVYGTIGFLCVFSFHLIVNMQNNYMDYVNAKDEEGYKKNTSTIGTNNVPLETVRNWIIGLSVLPLIASLWLAYQTGWTTFIIGVICVLIGLFYSFGPRPLNSLPIAELVVASAIAFFIPLVYIYLGMANRDAISWSIIAEVLLICLPNMLIFFSTLLANNTCDLDEDIKNGRHTLVYFLGKKNAVTLYKIVWAIAAILLPILAIMHVAPYTVLLVMLTYPKAYKTIEPYLKKQVKKETYFSALKGVNVVIVPSIVLFAIGVIFKL
ncbi:prenyltransferase [Companilactobacillus sp. RD055328]|uniref:prenyltransferase n=1 Tax=Companilactobacillus sp. RD055328 TaxID=2916634 RepID=UPI001FC82E8A|nr:prenyltransferase [Companilactobacillus sp. RD055328]GKQ42483.1 prenyltransferase [Companilactobacillus sp. RD055328]